MWGTIELPIWLVVLGAVLAVIAVIDRILGPWLRWMLRSRFKRAVARLNDRLAIRIDEFKLIKREVLIDRLTHDPEVLKALEVEAVATGKPVDLLAREVERYAREIVPSFSSFMYFAVGTRVSRWIVRMLYEIRVARFDPRLLKSLEGGTGVVFVMNHRSNADYLLATYLAQQTSALSYAVGEWARVWPLSAIIRAMGAYFIRRRSRNALYRRVLARYVQMATEAGVTQAIFPEGGLSRDGALQPAKLGLLSYILDGFDPSGARDVLFVPVGVNYDRVLEDRVLLSARTDASGRPRFRAGVFSSVSFVTKVIWRRATGRYRRFGHACVGFGPPLSLKAFLTEDGTRGADVLGAEIMRRIGAAIPVAPVPMVCSILFTAQEPLSREAIIALVERRLRDVPKRGSIAWPDPGQLVDDGLRVLELRHLVEHHDDRLTIGKHQEDIVRYYANTLAPSAPGAVPDVAAQ